MDEPNCGLKAAVTRSEQHDSDGGFSEDSAGFSCTAP